MSVYALGIVGVCILAMAGLGAGLGLLLLVVDARNTRRWTYIHRPEPVPVLGGWSVIRTIRPGDSRPADVEIRRRAEALKARRL